MSVREWEKRKKSRADNLLQTAHRHTNTHHTPPAHTEMKTLHWSTMPTITHTISGLDREFILIWMYSTLCHGSSFTPKGCVCVCVLVLMSPVKHGYANLMCEHLFNLVKIENTIHRFRIQFKSNIERYARILRSMYKIGETDEKYGKSFQATETEWMWI